MVKIDYISTKDINKVAKIHSSKKYFNWVMKMIDNEYRFYPPLVIDDVDDLDEFDDFTFEEDEEDISNLDIKKGMNTLAKIEKYEVEDIRVCKNSNRKINLDKYTEMNLGTDAYKLYRVKQVNNCFAKIDKYKDELVNNYKACRNKVYNAKIKKYLVQDEIEILTLDQLDCIDWM